MLLSKTLRSSTLKLAFIYVIGFSSAIFSVLGYVYWSTVAYVSEKLDRSITAERDLLIETYGDAGRNGLIALINQRSADKHFNEWGYLLTDASFIYAAGNVKSWPATLHGNKGWNKFFSLDWQLEAKEPTLFRATHHVLPDGYHLLLGRKVDDLERFGEKIMIGLAWVAGLFLVLAAAAGLTTHKLTSFESCLSG